MSQVKVREVKIEKVGNGFVLTPCSGVNIGRENTPSLVFESRKKLADFIIENGIYPESKCEWKYDPMTIDNGCDGYKTSCGNRYPDEVGALSTSEIKYCPYCGKEMIEVEK